MKNFILARFMIYKWLGPFNEMYIKLQQQHKKTETNQLVLMEMFDDLFGETYRSNSPSKKKKTQQYSNYLQTGTFVDLSDYNEQLGRFQKTDTYKEIQVKLLNKQQLGNPYLK